MANTNKQFLGFLGKKIRSEREKLELSQEEFGKKSGFHRTYIGMIDHNATAIARALGGEAPERGLNGKLKVTSKAP